MSSSLEKREGDLKNLALQRLASYPLLYRLFGGMTKNQIERNGWLAGDFVYLLLAPIPENLNMMHRLVEGIHEFDPQLLFDISEDNRLSGSEPDFDEKVGDLFAELNGADWLIRSGFQKILKIRRQGSGKHPDFRAQKNSETFLVEAKNIRSPEEQHGNLLSSFRREKLLKPDLYGDKTIFVTNRPFAVPSGADIEQYSVSKSIEQIESAIQSGKRHIKYGFFECQWFESEQPIILCSSHWSSAINNHDLSMHMFEGLCRKVASTIAYAYGQLTVDSSDSLRRIVLLNWQVVELFKIYTERQAQFSAWVSERNQEYTSLTPGCSVVLMNELHLQ